MKLAFIIFLFFNQFIIAQKVNDSIAITKVLIDDYEAFGNKDIDNHLNFLSEDYLLIENGEIWNLKQEIDYLKKNQNVKQQRTNTFEITDLQVFDKIAYVVYHLYSDITSEDVTKKYHWIETTILKKIDGNWKIALIHSTKLEEKKDD